LESPRMAGNKCVAVEDCPCVDDVLATRKGKLRCSEHLAKRTNKKCTKEGRDGNRNRKLCPKTCGLCDL